MSKSMGSKKLSDKLQFWRCERPDEWIMDEFIRDAQVLEASPQQVVKQQIPEGYVRVPKETLTNMALDMRDVRDKVTFEDAPDREARLLYAGWIGIIAVSQALDELLAEEQA